MYVVKYCRAPTFQGNSVCACFILSIIYAFAILVLLLPALFGSEIAKCKIKQYQFRINNCVKGNSDPNIVLLPAPFKVYSIQFNFEGSEAIDLKDHISNSYIHTTPEWDEDGRDEPAAYIRNTHPHIKVIFRKLGDLGIDTFTIGANGTLGGVTPQEITLVFNSSGLTDQIEFELGSPLPNAIGKHRVSLEWYARLNSSENKVLIGNTFHTICTTWKTMEPKPSEGLNDWVYKEPMLWTSEWASGKDNEKDICDTIIQKLYLSGLKYGVGAWDVRSVLINGGGMCGGWYKMFPHLAHCQGVYVHSRCYLVDWRTFPNNEVNWCAIVIKSAGLNQSQNPSSSTEFHDDNTAYPITTTTPIGTVTDKRWRFYGRSGGIYDGHCINFLVYNEKLYLYDPSFGTGPFEIASFTGFDAPLPPKNFTIVGGNQLSNFKSNYLNTAIDYMMGSLLDGNGVFFPCVVYGTNGITVKTSVIQDNVSFSDGQVRDGITFYWGP